MPTKAQLEQAIAALEGQRAILGDAVVEIALAPLHKQLASLTEPPVADQRKQITVLFADLSGFTALSESLDAEEVADLIQALWQRLDGVIMAHGGVIDKHLGDGVMALFGTPMAAEDDPERAIRAALALLHELKHFQPSTVTMPLEIRIGINTGPVLLGSVGSNAEYTALGDTVNLASRLEQAAPVGGILIAHHTYGHVRGVFDVQALEPIRVKGKLEPIKVYLVQNEKPKAFRITTRGIEGIETRMIGRDQELAHLQAALRTVFLTQASRFVSVVAEAGVGKSRLLYEFDKWIELLPEVVRFFRGRANPQLSRLPYGLLREIVAARFGILDSDRAHLARKKLESGIQEFLGSESQEKAHFIGQLIGFDFSFSPHLRGIIKDARQIRDRAFFYLSQLFQKQQPDYQATVIFLEDIHWADEGSLAFLEQLAQSGQQMPLLVISLTRPILWEKRPHWGTWPTHTRLDLVPLSASESYQLVVEILQKVPQVPKSLQDVIVQGAEGNPFYLEELIKVLIEDGVILKGLEHWQIQTERLAELRIPQTLTSLIQARLDALPAEERETLQRASVVGRVFWDQTITYLQESPTIVKPSLSGLETRELIFVRETTSFAQTREYIFKHAILHEVTYESVLKRLRRTYHQRVAQWLQDHSGERVLEYAGLIGEHYEQARVTDLAVYWYQQAGEAAQQIYANDTAIDYYQRLLKLIPAVDHAEVLLKLGQIWELTGKWAAAEQIYREALACAETKGDRGLQAHSQRSIGALLRLKSNHTEALEWLEQALGNFHNLEDAQGISRTVGNLGAVYKERGEYTRALGFYQQQLQIATELADKRSISISIGNMGVVYLHQGDYIRALACFERQLPLAQALADRFYVGMSTGNMGVAYQEQGNYARALECYAQQLHIASEIGDQPGISRVVGNMGVLYYDQGDYDRALLCYQYQLKTALGLGDQTMITVALTNMAEVYMAQGQIDRASHLCEKAIILSRNLNIPYYFCSFLCLQSDLYLKQGKLECIDDLITEAATLALHIGDREEQFKAQVLKARLILAQETQHLGLQTLSTMLTQWTEPMQQAALYYELWQASGEAVYGQEAAQGYRALYACIPNAIYRQRVFELTGEVLLAPSLPELPPLVAQTSVDLEAQLLQIDLRSGEYLLHAL